MPCHRCARQLELKSPFLMIRKAPTNWKSIHHRQPAPQYFQIRLGEERVPLAAL